MTTVLAFATLLSAPPAWTQHANLDELVRQDWEAFSAIEMAEGQVVVRSESRVLMIAGDGAVVAGIGGTMRVGDQTTPLVTVHFEDKPESATWLMRVSLNNPVSPENAWLSGRIGPSTVRGIIALVDGLRDHYGETGPMNEQGPTTVSYRAGRTLISYDFRQAYISSYGFSLTVPASDWPAVKSQWQKLPGVKTD